jgi:hypothetical protein
MGANSVASVRTETIELRVIAEEIRLARDRGLGCPRPAHLVADAAAT